VLPDELQDLMVKSWNEWGVSDGFHERPQAAHLRSPLGPFANPVEFEVTLRGARMILDIAESGAARPRR
jgi:hypothetical protein